MGDIFEEANIRSHSFYSCRNMTVLIKMYSSVYKHRKPCKCEQADADSV